MTNDCELLREYATHRTESAFTALVERHLDVVYSAAVREAHGDLALAEDISQLVFSELARQASRVHRHPTLAGWLYTAVRNVAANLRRGNVRRRLREEASSVMNTSCSPSDSEPAWDEIRPVIDDAMHDLGETDRAAVVLRFFEDRSLREVGEALGLTENAARMRVDRALDKLRQLLAARGIQSTASGIATALTVGAVMTAPAGLAGTLTASVFAAATATSTTTSLTLLNLMSLAKVKTTLVATLAVTAVSVPIWQETRVRGLDSENHQLRQQVVETSALREELDRLKRTTVSQSELDRFQASEVELKQEVARLRGRLASVLREEARADTARIAAQAAKAAESGSGKGILGGMNEMMQGMLEQQFEGRLTRMKSNLNLTPEQEQAAREILKRQATQATKAAQKLLAGGMTSEETADLQRDTGNPEAEIKALLTPEQLDSYQNYQRAEVMANARLAANGEVLQLQSLFGLSEEQQDQAFAALYDHTYGLLDGQLASATGAASSVTPLDPVAQLDQMIDQKVKALEGVLTPDQLARYRQLQQQQMSFVKKLMPQLKAPPAE